MFSFEVVDVRQGRPEGTPLRCVPPDQFSAEADGLSGAPLGLEDEEEAEDRIVEALLHALVCSRLEVAVDEGVEAVDAELEEAIGVVTQP